MLPAVSDMKPVVKSFLARSIGWVVARASDSYYGRYYYSERFHPHYALMEQALDETVAYIRQNMPDALVRRNGYDVLSYALRHAPAEGLHLEFGVRTGTTINHVARRRTTATFYGFDSFEGLPEAWSGYTMDRGAFGREALPSVRSNVELVVGWFSDTLPEFLASHPGQVAFVHVDSDIYSSARTVLGELADRFVPGSVIVFNEYFNYPNWQAHEFRAFQEFCEEHQVGYEYLCWGMYEVAVRLTSIGGDEAASGAREFSGGQLSGSPSS